MVESIMSNNDYTNTKVSQKEFDLFDREYIFDALKGGRYGLSFCQRFNIKDLILVVESNPDHCRRYIKKTYIKDDTLSN